MILSKFTQNLKKWNYLIPPQSQAVSSPSTMMEASGIPIQLRKKGSGNFRLAGLKNFPHGWATKQQQEPLAQLHPPGGQTGERRLQAWVCRAGPPTSRPHLSLGTGWAQVLSTSRSTQHWDTLGPEANCDKTDPTHQWPYTCSATPGPCHQTPGPSSACQQANPSLGTWLHPQWNNGSLSHSVVSFPPHGL